MRKTMQTSSRLLAWYERTSASLTRLQPTSTIEWLNIESCEVGDDGMSLLATALKVGCYCFCSDNLTQTGNTVLKALDVRDVRMTDAGAAAIAGALNCVANLTHLSVGNNMDKLTDQSIVALARGLQARMFSSNPDCDGFRVTGTCSPSELTRSAWEMSVLLHLRK